MIYLERSGAIEPGAPAFCMERLQNLFDLATSGRGSSEIASSTWDTPDYAIVRTAFHEAGHAAVARSFGLLAEIHLHSPSRGHCRYLAAPRKQHDCCISLAGATAEMRAISGYGAWWSDRKLCGWVPHYLSDSDLRGARPFDSADILECRGRVNQLWRDICHEAANVINRHVAAWSLQ